MKYYNIVNKKIILTEDGKKALKTLGITIIQLKDYPYEYLNSDYWGECKSYIDQALENGKGITWLDDCRIPTEATLGRSKGGWGNRIVGADDYGNFNSVGITKEGGRFPANLLISDDVLDDDIQRSQGHWVDSKVTGYGKFGGGKSEYFGVGDKDVPSSYSRYFSLDAWWQKHIKKLPLEVQKVFPFLIVPKAARSEKEDGLENFNPRDIIYSDYRKNFDNTKSSVSLYPDGTPRPMNSIKCTHPAVKPVKLLQYLITLGSRPNDVILDPFIGSGTTAIASRLENRKFIGFEREKEYWDIAQARLAEVMKQSFLWE